MSDTVFRVIKLILRVLLTGPTTAREVSEALSWGRSRTARDLRLLEDQEFVRRYPRKQGVVDIWEIVNRW